jgi:uncharacterized membrane protein
MFGFRRFARDKRGGIAVIAALSTGMILAFAALAIDLGSIFLQTRQLQGMADLAAIGAANDLQNAQAAAAATAGANNWDGQVQTAVVIGSYVPDPTIAAGKRFTPGGTSPNAAQVTLTAQANLFFGQPIMGSPTITIARTATAASAQMAAFSLGSGLLSVQGGVANSLLSGLTGSQVSLTAMDYNALLGANVDLLQYSQALQTKLNLQGASFSQVLSSQVTTGQALTVLGNLLSTNGQDPAGQAIDKIAAAASSSTPVQLQQLVNLGPYSNQDHTGAATGAGVSVNALDFASALLQLAQGGRQVQLALGGNVPGLTNLNVWLAIGQRASNSPWLTVNNDGTVTVTTAQARLYIDAQVAPGAGALTGAGVSLVNIPIVIQAASAQAKLTSLSCPSSTSAPAVTLAVMPSIGQINLGQVDTTTLNNFTQPLTVAPATLVNLAILQITGQAHVLIGGINWQAVSFSQNDIQSNVIKTVSTGDTVQALAASLLPNTVIQVQVLGLGIGLNQIPLTSAIQSTLTTVAPTLDQTIDALTNVLGVQLGVAYVGVNGLRCNNAALVA